MCGIGGRTIAEAKEIIGVDEFAQWVEFRALRGSLNVGRRIEQAVAMVAYQIHAGNGGKKNLSDFMPHEKVVDSSEDDEEELTPEMLMKMFGG